MQEQFRNQYYSCIRLKDSTSFYIENKQLLASDLINHRNNWKELLDWLKDRKVSKLIPLHNWCDSDYSCFTDICIDEFVGWLIIFDTPEEAILFKLTWA
jgi:adenine C2-methylase RlmN of 23S rRNA A2503 and tRNA A37